jgi:hypothetical protein
MFRLQATLPGLTVGPLTAKLVVDSNGRWWPTYVLAGALNFLGAVVYANFATTKQILWSISSKKRDAFINFSLMGGCDTYRTVGYRWMYKNVFILSTGVFGGGG